MADCSREYIFLLNLPTIAPRVHPAGRLKSIVINGWGTRNFFSSATPLWPSFPSRKPRFHQPPRRTNRKPPRFQIWVMAHLQAFPTGVCLGARCTGMRFVLLYRLLL